jgi:hypothetical protein
MIQKYIDTKGKERAGTQAIKEYFGSPGYPPVELKELKALMPSCGGPGTKELGDGAAEELGWTKKPE